MYYLQIVLKENCSQKKCLRKRSLNLSAFLVKSLLQIPPRSSSKWSSSWCSLKLAPLMTEISGWLNKISRHAGIVGPSWRMRRVVPRWGWAGGIVEKVWFLQPFIYHFGNIFSTVLYNIINATMDSSQNARNSILYSSPLNTSGDTLLRDTRRLIGRSLIVLARQVLNNCD